MSAIAAVDCNNPCGPDDILYCAGQAASPVLTAQQVFDQLVSKSGASQDQFCSSCTGLAYLNTVQQKFCSSYCPTEKGSYFSYSNFTTAYAAMKAADSTFAVACTGTADDRKKELANLLTTSAQETTNGTSYTNDGLYYRYENTALNNCTDTNCITQYYGQSDATVVAYDATNSKVFTQYYWNSGTINPDGTVSGNKVTLTGSGPSSWAWSANEAPPSGYTFRKLTNTNVPSAYWIGMGNIELTADSVMGFFGWYYNHLVSPTQTSADLYAFIQSYLKDGKIAYEGGFWYWNYRVNGRGFPTLHQVLASTGPVCHDIAISTAMVNGGCTTDPTGKAGDFPERKTYFTYFLSTVLGLPDSPTCINSSGSVVDCTSASVDLNSKVCYYSSSSTKLQDYCYSKVSP